VLVLFVWLAPLSAAATELPEEARTRIDYLIGTWDVYDEALNDTGEVIRTTHSIHITEYFLGDSVLVTTVIPDQGEVRKTIRFHDKQANTFYEISVGTEGDLYILKGGLDEYVMNFKSRQTRNGKTPIGRFIHTDIQPDSFEALLEMSRDEGKTWRRMKRNQRLVRRTGS
jgi:hypothetical protein